MMLLLVAATAAVAGCGSSDDDDDRLVALEESLALVRDQEREGREAAAAERAVITDRLSGLEQALREAEAEREANEELNAATRSLVVELATSDSVFRDMDGMGFSNEQAAQQAGMEIERLKQSEPRFTIEEATPEQRMVIEAGAECLALRDQEAPEEMQGLILESYRLTAERTGSDVELVTMTFMACGTAGIQPRDIENPSAQRTDAIAALVACYEEHEDFAGEPPSQEMVAQSLSILKDDGTAAAVAKLICQDLSLEATRQ